MLYRLYNVTEENQSEDDFAAIPADLTHKFFQYVDQDDYQFTAFASTDSHHSIWDLEDLKQMQFYAELDMGAVIFFRQGVNMWKWMYQHCTDFKIQSYGKLSA